MRAEQACAEAVEGAHECRLVVAPGAALSELEQAGPYALAQLRCGAVGERQREDLRRGEAVLAHSRDEPLHEHRGLAAAGRRRQRERSVPPRDRLVLLVGERHRIGLLEGGSLLGARPAHGRHRQIEG